MFSALWIIILIPGVFSISITKTLYSTSNNIGNKFPGKSRALNEGNNQNSNILSPLIIGAAGVASGVDEYSKSNDTVKALTAAATGVAKTATSVAAYHACDKGISYLLPGGVAGTIAGFACSYTSNYLYDLIFGSSSSNTDDTFSEEEINFMMDALSDDEKSVTFDDETYIGYTYPVYSRTDDDDDNYDRTSHPQNTNNGDDAAYIRYEINESDNLIIRDLRNQLRQNTNYKKKISNEYRINLKVYEDFIEINKKNPNSIHPDLIQKYYQIVKNLQDKYNRLKKNSNDLIRLIIQEAELADDFKKLNI